MMNQCPEILEYYRMMLDGSDVLFGGDSLSIGDVLHELCYLRC